jgi:hypothetical protein
VWEWCSCSGGTPLVCPAVAVLDMSQGLNSLRITLLVDLYGTARIGALGGA